MARLSVVLIFALLAIALAKPKNKKKFPPNKASTLTDKEIDASPKFTHNSRHRAVQLIPTAFDARTQWPKCDSIKKIRDQGMCGTCWAVSAASVLSDRICIASGQKTNILISANQAASCSVPSQTGQQNCDAGGDTSLVYKYASLYGLPTGGEFNSKEGCVPYEVGNNKQPPLTCAIKCTNSGYTTPMANDLKIVDSYWINYQKKDVKMTQQQIDAAVNQMQMDMMANGPITATITVYDDFQEWDSTEGVYKGPKTGAQNLGGHAVRIIGWNKHKDGTPYWLIANSWGTDVGEQGIYWLQLGNNTLGIENTLSAPIVNMPNPCSGSSFCDVPIDQAVLTNYKDLKSPAYLFQGNCTQQVSISPTGKLTAVGSAVPLSKVFLGAPAGPITSYLVQSDQLWLLNSAGQAGANCVQATGSTKFTCGGGSGSAGNSAAATYYAGSTLTRWSYYPNNKNWLFNTQGQGKNIGTLITDKFSDVTALLNIDGTKMVVFGKDPAGKSLAGIMSYPTANQASFAWVTQPGPTKSVLTCSATS